MGNIGSIQNMLKKIGVRDVCISGDAEVIRQADKLILPGVGAFDAGMEQLEVLGLRELILRHVEKGGSLLGICLGMQLLGRRSQEGSRLGLGLIPFECRRFAFPVKSSLKIPHMGWDRTKIEKKTPLTENLEENQRYYFVHSFHAVCEENENVLMSCEYGYRFPAAVYSGNVYGVQFHPEKSHVYGMRLLTNFAGGC